MAKKAKKANKVAASDVAVQNVNVVEDVFGTAPVGMDWNVGVSAEAVAAYENKNNGGSKEAQVKAEVIEAEIPVGGFNRNGMDALMTESIAPEVVVVVRGQEGDCIAALSCAGRPAYAVYVLLRAAGHVVIVHMRNILYVQPAGCDIRGD